MIRQAEVTLTAHQTNGGTYDNVLVISSGSNGQIVHTSHHWDELESAGGSDW